MKRPTQTVIIPSNRKSGQRSFWRHSYLFIAVAFISSLPLQLLGQCVQGCDTVKFNTFLGDFALLNNTTGSADVAIGESALKNNTVGNDNTGVGAYALVANGTGNNNTGLGYGALNTSIGSEDTAIGAHALITCSSGAQNTATGSDAMGGSTVTGNNNTANGFAALFDDSSGGSNTAHGANALFNNTTGSGNIALGASAGINLTTGNNNIYLGNAGGSGGESNRIRIGTKGVQNNTYIAGIFGVTVGSGVGVVVDSTGRLGTTTSSARYKDDVHPMDKASDVLLSLKPVTFRYRKELDSLGIPQFGLVAEDVAKVDPDLVAKDEQGKPYTVRYEAVNAMLLNEFLKEHRKVETLEATAAQQQSINTAERLEIDELKSALKTQAAQIQKVSAQLATARPVSAVAVNDK